MKVDVKKVLWSDCEKADSWLKKAFGVMFRKSVGKPMVFSFSSEARARNAIHSLFCPSFDAVFLDGGKRVVEVRRVKPFSFVTPKKACKYLIEAPPGSAEKHGIKPGNRIEWNSKRIFLLE